MSRGLLQIGWVLLTVGAACCAGSADDPAKDGGVSDASEAVTALRRMVEDQNRRIEALTRQVLLLEQRVQEAEGPAHTAASLLPAIVPDFAPSTPQIFDASVTYRAWSELQLRAGKFKSPVGLEQLQGDAQGLFNERSMVSQFVPLRNPGFLARGATSWSADVNWWLNRNVRLLLSYSQTMFDGADGERNPFDPAAGTPPSTVTLEQVRRAAGRLQLAYRERGYVTDGVGLPPQQITNATIRVNVTEGVLSDILVTGNRYFASNNVRRALPSLRTNRLLNGQVFQRELDTANRNPDRQIFPALGPGPDPGTSALTLHVEDRLPVHGRVEVNNLATPDTPEWRINTSAQYQNLWQREHQLGVSYGFSPEAYKPDGWDRGSLLNRPQIAYYGGFYRLPLGEVESVADRVAVNPAFGYDEASRQFRLPPTGARSELSLYASAASSDTGVQTGPAVVVTRTPLLTIVSQDAGRNLSENGVVGSRWSWPRFPSDRDSLTFSVGLEAKSVRLESYNTNNFIVRTVVTNLEGSQSIESQVSSPQPPQRFEAGYLPVSLGAEWSRTDVRGRTVGGLMVVGNLFRDSEDFATLANARSARAEFGRVVMQVARDQTLPGNWTLGLRAGGQAATGPLISNEQFALGGSGSVRGYYEGDEYGDDGWLVSTEWRTPFLKQRVPAGGRSRPVWLRGWVFTDVGQRWLRQPSAGVETSAVLLGTGFGISANLDNHVDLRVVVGWPWLDTPNTAAGDPRAYFSLGGQF